jgi:hypothetical protein
MHRRLLGARERFGEPLRAQLRLGSRLRSGARVRFGGGALRHGVRSPDLRTHARLALVQQLVARGVEPSARRDGLSLGQRELGQRAGAGLVGRRRAQALLVAEDGLADRVERRAHPLAVGGGIGIGSGVCGRMTALRIGIERKPQAGRFGGGHCSLLLCRSSRWRLVATGCQDWESEV